MNEKIQKLLANAGVGSRRQIEQWIREERIQVNGKLAHLGERPDVNARITIDGHAVDLVKSQNVKQRVLIYHKPEGEICTRSDPEKRPTVFDNLPSIRNSRWISVGRLDFNTSGLLLVTNDGELANRLMHPSTDIEREYAARIRGEVPPHLLTRLQKGVKLEDGVAHFDSIIDAGGTGSNRWYHVVVKEGRNRLVRRLFESQELQVSRLIRVRFGSLTLPPRLRRGHCMELEEEDIQTFIHSLDGTTDVKEKPAIKAPVKAANKMSEKREVKITILKRKPTRPKSSGHTAKTKHSFSKSRNGQKQDRRKKSMG